MGYFNFSTYPLACSPLLWPTCSKRPTNHSEIPIYWIRNNKTGMVDLSLCTPLLDNLGNIYHHSGEVGCSWKVLLTLHDLFLILKLVKWINNCHINGQFLSSISDNLKIDYFFHSLTLMTLSNVLTNNYVTIVLDPVGLGGGNLVYVITVKESSHLYFYLPFCEGKLDSVDKRKTQ